MKNFKLVLENNVPRSKLQFMKVVGKKIIFDMSGLDPIDIVVFMKFYYEGKKVQTDDTQRVVNYLKAAEFYGEEEI